MLKYTQHKIYSFKHFSAYSWVALNPPIQRKSLESVAQACGRPKEAVAKGEHGHVDDRGQTPGLQGWTQGTHAAGWGMDTLG
jgi:hypothetical protein